MKINQAFSSGLLAFSLLVLTTVSAQAKEEVRLMQEQSQGNSMSVSTECTNGNCKSEASGSQSQEQRQYMNVGAKNLGADDDWSWSNRKPTIWGRRVGLETGQVRLTWPMRGGTCHVRYTENSESGYKYATSASCDDGGMTIGGLQSRQMYRFQIKQDDGEWSRTTRLMAR